MAKVPPRNLREVLEVVELLPKGTPSLAELRSALKTASRILNLSLEDIPAQPAALRELVARANPALVGMTPARWGTVRSLMLRAMTVAGVDVMPGRLRNGLTSEWSALYEALPNKRLKVGLSRLLQYLSGAGVGPSEVTTESLNGFDHALATRSLDPHPASSANSMARLWREAGQVVAGWPRVDAQITPDPRRYSLGWDAFPISFTSDVEAFLAAKSEPNPFSDDYSPPVRAATIRSRRKMLRAIASSLVASGFPRGELTGLAALTTLGNAKRALMHARSRNGNKSNQHIINQAYLLRTIAKYWVRSSGAEVSALTLLATNLRRDLPNTPKGMRPKNRERLRQFDDIDNIRSLLKLPGVVLSDARALTQVTRGDAVRVAAALQVELFTVTALRIHNVASLEIARHFQSVRRVANEKRYIVIPPEESKTGVPIELELGRDTCKLLDEYLKKFRPLVYGGRSPYLFPGRGGSLRSTDSLANGLRKFIRRETGLQMHPHLFRHLAVKLHLNAHPHDLETPRRLLGHTSSRVTARAYGDLANDAAHRRHDALLEDLRKAEWERMKSLGKKKKKKNEKEGRKTPIPPTNGDG